MLKKTEKGYWVLEKFAQQKGLIHGFSTRKFGSMSVKKSLKENENLDKFLKIFGKGQDDLIMMEQIHGNQVKKVGDENKGKVFPSIDGLVCTQPGVILGVKTADCLPLLFFDPKTKIIGIAHAGWKGILRKIGQVVVKKMKLLGCQSKNILVGIGPHVGDCCYTVSVKRADKFEKAFGNLKGMIKEDCERIHLDLMVPMRVQLIKVGVLGKNIDVSLNCTSCQNAEFFSFRKNKGKDFGEVLGIIGLRTIPERSWK